MKKVLASIIIILIVLFVILSGFIFLNRAIIFQLGNPLPYITKAAFLTDTNPVANVFDDNTTYIMHANNSESMVEFIESEFDVAFTEQFGSAYVFESDDNILTASTEIYLKFYTVFTVEVIENINTNTEIDSIITWNSDSLYAAALIGGYSDDMEAIKGEPQDFFVPNVRDSHEFGDAGNEKYLIVPRYTNMYIEVYEMELSDEGELIKKFDEPALVTQEGAILWLSCNVSDLYPDVLLVFKQGDKIVDEVSPFVSLKDGEIVLTDKGQVLFFAFPA